MIENPYSVIVDATERMASLDAFGRLRVGEPYSIFDSKQVYDEDPLSWDTDTSGAGSSVAYQSSRASSLLTADTGATDYAIRQTKRYFNYQPGKSFLVLATFNMNGQEANCVKRVGYFDADNGIFFEVTGTEVAVTVRSNVSGSPVDNRVLQANWNLDPMDGTGPSGITLDTSKVQIFACDMEWLGVGTVRVGFVIDGNFVYVHQFHTANIGTSVYMRTPNLPMRYQVLNSAAGGGGTLEAICCSVISEGGIQELGTVRSANRGNTSTIIQNTYEPIIQIRLASGYERAPVFPKRMSIVSSTGADFIWGLFLNPTITGGAAAVWTAASNAVEYDITQNGTVSGGTLLDSGYVSNNNDQLSGLFDSQVALAADIAGTSDVLVLACHKLGGATNETFYGGITWLEGA